MNTFILERALDPASAVRAYGAGGDVAYISGGTTVVDLAKLGVLPVERLIDLSPLHQQLSGVTREQDRLILGSMTTMAQAASALEQDELALLRESLLLAASGQLRNMATLGGNVLQRTRCTYFRDPHSTCNKRLPGSGCAALTGDRRGLAILGTSSSCVANYPGDLAIALVALEAKLTVMGLDETQRTLDFEQLHQLPADRPHQETTLKPGELILSLTVPLEPWDGSTYVKVRDRASYAFALTSAAVALRLSEDAETIAQARVALGGMVAKPWRAHEVERSLIGQPLTLALATAAAQRCFEEARADEQQNFKVELGVRTIVKALMTALSRANHKRSSVDE